MGPLGEDPDLLDDRVALGPGGDRIGHQRRLVEPQEQADHPGDVAVVGAALEQAAPGLGPVGIGALQGLARDPVADGEGERPEEPLVVLLAMVLGVLDQVQLGVLLPLRVQALARDVGADRRHQIDADDRDQQLQGDDAGEDGQHRPGTPAKAQPLLVHRNASGASDPGTSVRKRARSAHADRRWRLKRTPAKQATSGERTWPKGTASERGATRVCGRRRAGRHAVRTRS